MTKQERKEYMKAYMKAYRQTKYEEMKAYANAYYEANKEEKKAYMKAYRQAHKEQIKSSAKDYYEANKEKCYTSSKKYKKADMNSLGQTKSSIRHKSWRILKKMNLNIHGYQIHHCFGYEDPSKFIYCSKELHLKIHQFLRDNNIDADSDHYEQIKQLLDENVVTFGL